LKIHPSVALGLFVLAGFLAAVNMACTTMPPETPSSGTSIPWWCSDFLQIQMDSLPWSSASASWAYLPLS
jgi:hypothetical protein